MLLATQSQSILGAQKYFELVLTQGDYYLGQEVGGQWRGKGAELLGLGQGARVTREQFADLLRGRHPLTGARLTQRTRQDRRPGMDLTFSVPKSVSLAWAVGDDEQIIEILRAATHETMQHDVEPLAARRVRTGKLAATKQKALTGKLIYADFLHKTSRPVDGVPDPHLHIHAFVMNWTEQEGKHYAAEMEEIVRQRSSLQAKFEARLARKLEERGYRVEQVRYVQSGRMKRGWEINGIARSTIEKFSRRTAEIEQYANLHGVVDASKKGKLGKLTREKKQTGQTVDKLRENWLARLTPAERSALANLRTQAPRREAANEEERAAKSVTYALEHCLYRRSTVERQELVGAALEHGLTLRVKDVEQAIDKMDLIKRSVKINGAERQLVTTRSVLEAERRMIAYARDGRGIKKAIRADEHQFKRDWLNDQQKDAVRHVVGSRDAVVAILGGAGTGKTSLMQEAVEAIQQGSKQVFTFAPSTGAKEVLQQKGFNSAQTVEHLIRNTRLQSQLKDQVVWVDEAGLVDVRSMNEVFKIAQEQNARVVLSGDPRQHASPRRGDALRLLEHEAGLSAARADVIQRQKGEYRRAVALVSRGHEIVDPRTGKTGLEAGFDLLDALGKIKELGPGDRHVQLAKTYVEALSNGKTSLVVSPTHAEAASATAEIRSLLREQGKLSSDEQQVLRYRSLNLTEAEKSEPRTYSKHEGVVIEFHQNARGGFQRGERYRVVGAGDDRVVLTPLRGAGLSKNLPLEAAARFEVYTEDKVAIAPGDQIRFSLGGTTRNNKSRISNGRLDEVKGFDKQGNLVLKNGWVVDKEFAHLDLGYVVTSHASQGKDRQVAIGAMGAESLPAINAKQFYVTVSRGSEDVVLYVDNKTQVRRAIQRPGERLSASEMIRASQGRRGAARPGSQRQRAGLVGSFRERVVKWWRGLSGDRSANSPAAREGLTGIGPVIGMGLTPSPGRSRG